MVTIPRKCVCHLAGTGNFPPGKCLFCLQYEESQEYRTAMGGGLLPARRKRPCRHLGAETGETAECPVCPGGGGDKRIPLLACAVHGVTTGKRGAPGKRSCHNCNEYAPPPPKQIHLNEGGIGDHLCALACAEGVRRADPSRDVVLVGRQDRFDWIRLFAGEVWLEPHELPGAGWTVNLDIHIYERLLRERRPRWELWAEQCGTVPVLPNVSLPAAASAWARRFAGCVALVPFAAHAVRTWPLERWLELERLLHSRGLRTVVLDDQQGRCQRFTGDKLEGESPERVTAVLQLSATVVGNDSGMAHVAGCLRRPTVAICAYASDERIFGLYPTVRSLGGRTGGGLLAVRPDEVLRTVEGMLNEGQSREVVHPESEIQKHCAAARGHLYSGWDSYTVERETAELLTALVRSFKPELILETGSYHGRSTRFLADACRRNGVGRVVTLEANADCAAEASRYLRDFPEVQVVQSDSLAWLREYSGPPFGLVFLDSDRYTRVEELRLLRERGLALGPVLVHDTSRHRGEAGYEDDLEFPARLDALGLPSLENPFARGWRLFDLSKRG